MKTSKYLFRTPYTIVILLSMVCAFPCYGQIQKKQKITEKDYALWGTLSLDKISEKGQWTSFAMVYDDSPDTLFIKQTHGNKMHKIAGSRNGEFSKEDAFACLTDQSALLVFNLGTDSAKNFQNVIQYSFSEDGKYLITIEGDSVQTNLIIRDLKGTTLRTITNIDKFSMNFQKNLLGCTGTEQGMSRVFKIDLTHNLKDTIITKDAHGDFSHIVWSKDNPTFAFLHKNQKNGMTSVYLSSGKDDGYTKFEHGEAPKFPKGYAIPDGFESGLTVSPDGKKVFFRIKAQLEITKNSVQIWNGNDAIVHAENQFIGDALKNIKTGIWKPDTNKFELLTSDSIPLGSLNPTMDYFIGYNPEELGIQYKLFRDVNFYVTDIESSKSRMILKSQSSEMEKTSLSPFGKYFAYFVNGNWWIYDFKRGTNLNLTKKFNIQIIDNEDPTQMGTFGVGGWTENDGSLLLYDQFDIWKFDTTGAKPVRLTKGREQNIVFRVHATEKVKSSSMEEHVVKPTIDLANSVFLLGKGKSKTGFFVLKPNGTTEKLSYGNFLHSELLKAKRSESLVFQRQSFDSPPEILWNDGNNTTTKSIFTSNSHQDRFQWGTQEVINYTNSKGNDLKGILYYPNDYDPNKKYPLVVNVYEKQFYFLNRYINPSNYGMKGFNISDLTANGYFVFLPDIEYELGNPGFSAADCVISATKKVIGKGIISKDKIALMGHSFGGYQTNFIIGQTNMFACAVSGASVADLRSWYFSIGWNMGRPEIWRFENQQWRMGKSFFMRKDGYEKNSPLTYADKIDTPILLWSGELDRQIHYYQSISFYIALRRLQKKEILLIYPNEPHAIMDRSNQLDLNNRIKQWLGYFLKDDRSTKWISNGL